MNEIKLTIPLDEMEARLNSRIESLEKQNELLLASVNELDAKIDENMKLCKLIKELLGALLEKPSIPVEPNPEIPEKPEVPEVPEVTPPSNEFKNIQKDWDEFLSGNDTHLTISGNCEVPLITTHNVNSLKVIKGENNALIKFGVENYNKWSAEIAQSGSLIRLTNGAKVLIQNVDICQPKQLTNVIEPWRPKIFVSEPNKDSKWTAIVDNCDTTKLGENGGFGIGFVYGGTGENSIMARNMIHVGDQFCDAKVAVGRDPDSVLKLVLHDVKTGSDDDKQFATNALKIRGVIDNEKLTITSNDLMDQFRNSYFDENTKHSMGNYACLIHVGRFTMMYDPERIIDNKSVGIRPIAKGKVKITVKGGSAYLHNDYEGHAGDSFSIDGKTYDISEKNRTDFNLWADSYNNGWKDNFFTQNPSLKIKQPLVDGDYDVQWNSSFDINGEQEMYLIYKESSHWFKTTPSTQFKDAEVMSGGVIGHNMYNHHNITLDARNVVQKGFYRQSPRGGKCLGYNMINCTGFKNQFDPPVEVTNLDLPLPKEMEELLNKKIK